MSSMRFLVLYTLLNKGFFRSIKHDLMSIHLCYSTPFKFQSTVRNFFLSRPFILIMQAALLCVNSCRIHLLVKVL